MKKILIFLLTIPLFFPATAQKDFTTRTYLDDPAWTPRSHNVDFKHLLLKVHFNPDKKQVSGEVTHTFFTLQKQVDSIFLDAPGIQIISADLDGSAISFETTPGGVIFRPEKPLPWHTQHNLHIHYEATPEKGLYFIGWDDEKNVSRKQIWTQGQGIDNRYWIPMYDEMNDKITSEIIVEFDSRYKVLSNGTLVAQKHNKKSNTTTWHYKMTHPHAPYLIMLGIGEYNIKTVTSKGGVKINLWYYPDWEDRVAQTYRYSTQMMDFFEKETGVKFPWENYSQIPVQDFMYGAMENTTATLFGDFLFVDKRAALDREYLAVNAHELAHQWFGDYVTARSDAHHWLQESFATFYNWLVEREVYGQDHYDWNRRIAQWNSLNASKKDDKQVMHSQAGSTRHYPKGAFVLHMLRYVTGREEYNAAIKHYLQKHAYGNVDTEDLLTTFHETLGNSYDWFFEQWIYHGGEPHYRVHYNEIQQNGKSFHQFTVKQEQPVNRLVPLFKMPVTFRVVYSDETKQEQTDWIEHQSQHVLLRKQGDKETAFVLFDVNNQILKEVSFDKPLDMLKQQALNAEYMLDRYDAVVAMRDVPLKDKMDILPQVFDKESFHAVKAEIVKQLAQGNELTAKFMQKAFTDKDVNVRKAALNSLVKIPAYLQASVEKLLKDSSYQIIEQALDKLCFSFPNEVKKFLSVTEKEVGAIGKNVRIKWLEMAINYTAAPQTNELVDYTSNSFEFRTRINAINALQRLNYFSVPLLENIISGINSSNRRLAQPFKNALKHFYAQTKYKTIIYNHISSLKDEALKEKLLSVIL